MMRISTSTPTQCAAEILRAWRNNDLEQLHAGLAAAAAIEFSPEEDIFECERAELLGSIASEVRGMMASGRMDGAAVYQSLLSHLADSSRLTAAMGC